MHSESSFWVEARPGTYCALGVSCDPPSNLQGMQPHRSICSKSIWIPDIMIGNFELPTRTCRATLNIKFGASIGTENASAWDEMCSLSRESPIYPDDFLWFYWLSHRFFCMRKALASISKIFEICFCFGKMEMWQRSIDRHPEKSIHLVMAGASFSSIMRKLDGKLKADQIADGKLKL